MQESMWTPTAFGLRFRPLRERAILLHCSASNGGQWKRLEETLGAEFSVYAPDQWDCGCAEPWPGDRPFDLEGEAEPVMEFIELSPAPVHLVGHSYGGALAMHIAGKLPNKLSSLTLVEPSAFYLLDQGGTADRSLFGEIRDVARCVNEAVLSGEHSRGAKLFVDYWSGSGSWDASSGRSRRHLIGTLHKTVLDFRALFVEETRLADFAALSVPTFLIAGDQSPGPSRRIVELLAETFPIVSRETIKGAGHMSPFTHAETVTELIAAFLHRHAETSRDAA